LKPRKVYVDILLCTYLKRADHQIGAIWSYSAEVEKKSFGVSPTRRSRFEEKTYSIR